MGVGGGGTVKHTREQRGTALSPTTPPPHTHSRKKTNDSKPYSDRMTYTTAVMTSDCAY